MKALITFSYQINEHTYFYTKLVDANLVSYTISFEFAKYRDNEINNQRFYRKHLAVINVVEIKINSVYAADIKEYIENQ